MASTMTCSSAKRILHLLIIWIQLRHIGALEFNKKLTGVHFSPYLQIEGLDIQSSAIATTTDNVKAMLEVVSTKFSRVLVFSVDAADAPYQRHLTYNYKTGVRAKTPETAARINRERGNPLLTTMLGVSLTWGKSQESETEVRVALEAMQIANSIYPGTVEGIYLSNFDTSGLEWAVETLRWLKFLRNNTQNFGVPIGTEQPCDGDEMFQGLNQSDPNSIKIASLRKEMVLNSDFLICNGGPGKDTMLTFGPIVAFHLLKANILKSQNLIKSIHKQNEVMWRTFWPKFEMNETKEDYSNLATYWSEANNFATQNNFTVWLDGAFENALSQTIVPWWKLTQFDQRNNVSAFVENYSGKRARFENDENVPRSSSTTSPTSTSTAKLETTVPTTEAISTTTEVKHTTTKATPTTTEASSTTTEITTTTTEVAPTTTETTSTAEQTSTTTEPTSTTTEATSTTTEPTPTTMETAFTTTGVIFTTTEASFLSTSTTTLEGSTNFPGHVEVDSSLFWKYIGVALGATALLLLVALFFLICKRLKTTRVIILTRQEIDEFLLGTSSSNGQIQNEYEGSVNVDALKFPYDTTLEMSKENLEILPNQTLGGGEFGCVCKALLKDGTGTQKEVALKMTKPAGGSTAVRGLLSEIKILSYLGHHPNIVPILGAYTAEIRKGVVYVATELCPLGSLKDCLKNIRDNTKLLDRSTIPFNDMLRWSNEIACGMEYLGQKGVIHADLATRNVLLSSNSVAKITDFGLSRRLYEYTNYTKTHQEPLPWRWMAVESLKTLEFSTKSDVWSFGVTLWEIFSIGGTPYPGLMWTIDFVEMLEEGLKLKSPKFASSEIYEVMTECWNIDKDSRPSFTELKKSTRQLLIKAMDNVDSDDVCSKPETTPRGTYGAKMNLYYNGDSPYPLSNATSFF